MQDLSGNQHTENQSRAQDDPSSAENGGQYDGLYITYGRYLQRHAADCGKGTIGKALYDLRQSVIDLEDACHEETKRQSLSKV